jgi:hypothetical protein
LPDGIAVWTGDTRDTRPTRTYSFSDNVSLILGEAAHADHRCSVEHGT